MPSVDADRFDALSRALTRAGSRRSTLRALFGTLLGSALREPAAETLAARATHHGKPSANAARRKRDDHHPGDPKRKADRGKSRHQAQSPDRTDTSTPAVADDAGRTESLEVSRDAVRTAACSGAGVACTKPGQCCTGTCLSTGKCSCTASNPCPKP